MKSTCPTQTQPARTQRELHLYYTVSRWGSRCICTMFRVGCGMLRVGSATLFGYQHVDLEYWQCEPLALGAVPSAMTQREWFRVAVEYRL